MRLAPAILLSLLFLSGYTQETDCDSLRFDESDILINRDGKPFSGCCKRILRDEENQKAIRSYSVECYEEGIPHGRQTYYYPGGQVMAHISYAHGLEDSTWTYYYSDGSIQDISFYNQGKRTGIWMDYFRNAKVFRREEYANDTLISSVKFFENGRPATKIERVSPAYELHSHFYEDGKPKSREWFHNSRFDSLCSYWYENGKLRAEMNYRDGFLQDTSWYYKRSGRLESIGIYSGGKKADEYVLYDRKGRMKQRIITLDEQRIQLEDYRKWVYRKIQIIDL